MEYICEKEKAEDMEKNEEVLEHEPIASPFINDKIKYNKPSLSQNSATM